LASLATQQILAFVRQSCETVYHHQDDLAVGQPSSSSSNLDNSNPENRKKKKSKKTK
jgi:hypothetical protein